MAYIGIAYDIYQVSCLKEPQKAFGLLPGTNLAFINISVNKTQATKIMFGGLGNLIRNSPYFREKFPFDANAALKTPSPKSACWVAATG